MVVRWGLVALLALPHTCLADLPVHCLRHQVVGDWEFTLGPLKKHRSPCGHHKPDNPDSQPKLNFLEKHGPTTTMKVTLQDPSTAVSADGTSGTWTMIYDEAFEVALGDSVFLAFSNFEYVQDPGKERRNVSHCDATQVGWYHNVDRTQWGCYLGRKAGSIAPVESAPPADDVKPDAVLSAAAGIDLAPTDPPAAQTDAAPADTSASPQASLAVMTSEQTQAVVTDSSDDDSQSTATQADDTTDSQQSSSDAQQVADTSALVDAYQMPDDYKPWVPGSAGFDKPMHPKWQSSVADALNFLQLGWTATAYELFEGKTPRQLNKFAGVKHSRPVPQGGFRSSMSSETDEMFNSFLGLRSRVKRVTPGHKTFDWQNKDGKNWLQPVVTQGDCGSCYTISTVHMLTARNRIAKNDAQKMPFSVTFPLYCSEYNQGCDGGYGFLQSKWSEDVGLVPESCAPFSESSGMCHALIDCDLGSTRFRATNHHYVGGFYGASEESSIKEELVKNGPVVMSFEPKEDFMYYKAGVYKSGANKIHQEWEQVDHAVLLTGFGEDKSQPYWTLQNSWGTDWGEAGFFRMARGIDESGCESIVVAAEVVEESSNDVLDDFLNRL